MSVAPEAEATTCNNDTSSASKTGASQIFDLIKNHPEDFESNSHPRSNNTDLIDGTDHVSSNSAKDIDLMKVTLNQQGSEPAAKKHKKDSPRHARRQTESTEELLESKEAKVYNVLAAEFDHDFDELMQMLDTLNPLDDLDDLRDWSWDIDEFIEGLCTSSPRSLADDFL